MQEPEKLEERLKELQSLLDKQKSSLTHAERKSRDLQLKLDAISKVAPTQPCLYFPATIRLRHCPACWSAEKFSAAHKTPFYGENMQTLCAGQIETAKLKDWPHQHSSHDHVGAGFW